MPTATLTIKPKQVVKKLVSVLSERARDVIISRYGLGKDNERMTLDAIGKRYGITRERVRQIENHALMAIRKSKPYTDEQPAFAELEKAIKDFGGITTEADILAHISKDKSVQNHLHLILVLGQQFKKLKEDDHFNERWHIDDNLADIVHMSLHKLYESLTDEELIAEQDIIGKFLENLTTVGAEYKNEEILKRWLRISKRIGKNPLGEWGVAHSPNVNAKGMRDYAFLVLRKHGSPIHFTEVAKKISKVFGKKAHVATTHNELIKDPRFVLVGRGLYALKEWGYISGVVKDVIQKVLSEHGPLKKEDIIDRVLKERYVKENTILVNLQNQKLFKRDKEGRYSLSN
ncbi:MAG TPA: sigma factor-like helix-turn-helix DNA-binding protein [Candidatus Paceibacterota bacterium]|nr:sigma factor-like helix-turn-helix DNA-binding protein [Candidatus Paceibacterota bacterium]